MLKALTILQNYENLMYSVINYHSLELIDNLSDTLPVQLSLVNHTKHYMLSQINFIDNHSFSRVKNPDLIKPEVMISYFIKTGITFICLRLSFPNLSWSVMTFYVTAQKMHNLYDRVVIPIVYLCMYKRAIPHI